MWDTGGTSLNFWATTQLFCYKPVSDAQACWKDFTFPSSSLINVESAGKGWEIKLNVETVCVLKDILGVKSKSNAGFCLDFHLASVWPLTVLRPFHPAEASATASPAQCDNQPLVKDPGCTEVIPLHSPTSLERSHTITLPGAIAGTMPAISHELCVSFCLNVRTMGDESAN